jgi:hypothetical protein
MCTHWHAIHKRTYHLAMQRSEHRNDAANLYRQASESSKCRIVQLRTHRQASQLRQDLPGSRVLVQPCRRVSRTETEERVLLRAHFVNRVLRPRSDADPPPFLGRSSPTILPLLEIRQPLDYRRYPARRRVLQTHREQLVVPIENPLRRGELDAGEREQRCVGLPCEGRDHAGCLFEREEPADCVRARGELCCGEAGVGRRGDVLGLGLRTLVTCERYYEA